MLLFEALVIPTSNDRVSSLWFCVSFPCSAWPNLQTFASFSVTRGKKENRIRAALLAACVSRMLHEADSLFHAFTFMHCLLIHDFSIFLTDISPID